MDTARTSMKIKTGEKYMVRRNLNGEAYETIVYKITKDLDGVYFIHFKDEIGLPDVKTAPNFKRIVEAAQLPQDVEDEIEI